MKFFTKAMIIGVAIILLAGCSSGNNKEKSNTLTVGIDQLAEHPALDDARKGFEDGLKEYGVNAKVDYKNAQGEIATANSIAQKFVDDKVDLIFAIATPAAQSVQQATKDIPVVFSAVTDGVESKLVSSNEKPGGNITGTLDAAPMEKQLALFKGFGKDIAKVGIIYNTGEENSRIQVNEAKKIAGKLGLEIVEIGVNNINDVSQTLDSSLSKVQGLYTITDNMIASSISVIAEKANELKIPTVGAEEAHVKGGILVSDGISYYELGKQSARMAKEILIDKKKPGEISVEKAEKTTKVYNEKTLKTLGLGMDVKALEGASPSK